MNAFVVVYSPRALNFFVTKTDGTDETEQANNRRIDFLQRMTLFWEAVRHAAAK